MRCLILPFVCMISILCCSKNQSPEIDATQNELMAHIRFLASDELRGREVGKAETKIAARYIVEQFRAVGLQKFNSITSYLQKTEFVVDGKMVSCNNVLGYIEGKDEKLKDEYILLCAHYDHLGVKRDSNNVECDSIFNGARDNAMGATALIYAAKELSKSGPKRSVIFLATTGEEEGMLGSKFFIDHCPIPVKQIVFVLNNDGGGFNATTNIRIGGKNKILVHPDFWNTTTKYGIECLDYPDELEYLYEKGDNITFARNGIPSIIVSPGFDVIDETILKFVHTPEDEVDEGFNCEYLFRFSKSYRDLALNIANSELIPGWSPDTNFSFR